MSDLIIFLSLVCAGFSIALYVKIWLATNNVAKSTKMLEELLQHSSDAGLKKWAIYKKIVETCKLNDVEWKSKPDGIRGSIHKYVKEPYVDHLIKKHNAEGIYSYEQFVEDYAQNDGKIV